MSAGACTPLGTCAGARARACARSLRARARLGAGPHGLGAGPHACSHPRPPHAVVAGRARARAQRPMTSHRRGRGAPPR